MPFDQWSENIPTMFLIIALPADLYELYSKKFQLTTEVHSDAEKKVVARAFGY